MKKLAIWHDGEKTIQNSIGVADRMENTGRHLIRDHLTDQHRDFFAQVPFVVAGTVDPRGDAWVTLLAGHPGFVSSATPQSLDIFAPLDFSDPASEALRAGAAIGLLGIDLNTRRRNRVNGLIRSTAGNSLQIDVDQTFGNCPQYIQLRDYSFVRDPLLPSHADAEEHSEIETEDRDFISRADTFFVASYAEREDRRQVDASHRGGKAGFVRINDDGTLTIPDFAGNLFFNTLGNFLLNGKAGLAFVDFETGDMLQMTGDASVILDSPEIAAFQGAERLWTFRSRRVVRRHNALALHWSFKPDGWSPNSLMTGDWQQAVDRMRAAELKATWRPFRTAKIIDEAANIRSFHVEPADGAGLIPHLAGQHLPIRVSVAGEDRPLIRTYTLSVAPSDGVYRITVKREGRVSKHLHDTMKVGGVLEARAPNGDFIIDPHEQRPAVLLGAGIGITPLIAMLRNIVYEGLRKRAVRPTILFYGARTKADRPFDQELEELVAAARGQMRVVRILSDIRGSVEGIDYDAEGRMDMALLEQVLTFGDPDFYLCGPSSFTQALYDGLRSKDVLDGRIHAEGFGPSSLRRSADPSEGGDVLSPPSTQPVKVIFTASLKEARWTPGAGFLLDLAEARGLKPDYSCRLGSCGTCRAKLVSGAVTYASKPSASVAADEVLICCAMPAAVGGDEPAEIQLAI